MTNIKVNPQKSVLISNTKKSYSITFLNSSIQTQPLHTPFKFLGCWFTTNTKTYPQIKLITQEIFEIINTLNTKMITDKQASYIINTVITPILEYRIHNIVLSQSLCNKILAKYLTVAKHKARLAKSTPNSTMLNHNIYGIKNIWDIQLQHHISNLTSRLNNKELLGTSTHIRLQQLQNNLWSTTNILLHPNPKIDGANKNTTTFKIIQLLKHLELSIHAHSDIMQPYTIDLPYTPLENILQTHTNYPIFKCQLRSKHIIFLEQLTSFDNSVLLTWEHISPRINSLIPGKIPKWFTILENKITTNSITRQLISTLQLPSVNSLSYTTGHFNTKNKPWLITYKEQTIIMGKARRFNQQTNTISITYWTSEIDETKTTLYPTSNIICYPCTGCSLNSKRIQSCCTIDISATLSTKFLGRKVYKQISNKLKLNANYLDLLFSIASRHSVSIPPLPSITIYLTAINDIFSSNTATNILQSIAQANTTFSEFTFYTDGSVINLGNSRCSMGIAWIQTFNDSIIHQFSAQIQYWPSSYKAELIAILSAICTCPRNSTIHIYTDSQSIISKYKALLHAKYNPSKIYLYNYWPI